MKITYSAAKMSSLRTKLSMQNQIEKDESYYRDEILKLKSDFKKELKLKEDSLTNLKDQLQDVSTLTNKAEYHYKDALRDKEHELERVKEELSRREEMISNINEGLLKAKDEATATYSDYVKENNRLKIAVNQVQMHMKNCTKNIRNLPEYIVNN